MERQWQFPQVEGEITKRTPAEAGVRGAAMDQLLVPFRLTPEYAAYARTLM